MAVSVIIPWSDGCPVRERALGWVCDWYERHHPSFRVEIGTARSDPWVKALAVADALGRTKDGVVVVADADVICDGLEEAIRAVEMGAPWAKPHRDVHRLSEEGTEAVYNGGDWREQSLDREVYRGVAGGGFVVARREVILSIPLDSRFTGWG